MWPMMMRIATSSLRRGWSANSRGQQQQRAAGEGNFLDESSSA